MLRLRTISRSAAFWIAVLLLALLGIAVFSEQMFQTTLGQHYLPIHAGLEILSISMGAAVFGIIWSLRTTLKDARLKILGVVALGVAVLDFLHMFSYPGMPRMFTSSNTEKAIVFWLQARLLLAVGLLLMAWLPMSWQDNLEKHDLRIISRITIWTVGLIVFVTALVTFRYLEWLPRTYLPDTGLTPFKIWFDVVLVVLFVVAALSFYLRGSMWSQKIRDNLISAAFVFAVGEVFFTIYGDVTDLYNLFGHICKIIGFYYLYRAVFVQLIQYPYDALKVARANLEATLETLPDRLIEVTPQGHLVAIHVGLVGQIYPQLKWFPGAYIYDFLPRPACDALMAAIDRISDQNPIANTRVILADERRERFYDLSVSKKVVEGAGHTFLVLIRDVTQKVFHEKKLEYDVGTNLMLLNLEEKTHGLDETHYARTALEDISRLMESPQVCLIYSIADAEKEPQVVCLNEFEDQSLMTRLWAWSEQNRSRVLCNDVASGEFQGLPVDEVTFQRLLTSSVYEDNQTRLTIVVANKAQSYGVLDADALDRIAETLWRGIKQRRQEVLIGTLSQALGQSPYPVIITNTELAIEYVNDAFVALSGYTPSEILGRTPRVLKSGQTPKTVYEEMWGKLNHGQTWHGELTNRRKDGQIYTEQSTIYPVRNQQNEITHYVAHKEDITLERQTQARIHQLSNYDQLTGLVNRDVFEGMLTQLLSRTSQGNWPLTVLWLDIDNFKNVNDSLGHDAGNLLLIEISNRLRHAAGTQTTVARVSGNGFVVLLTRSDQQATALLAHRLLDIVQEPTTLMGRRVVVSASIGISQFPGDAETASGLLLNAETAMYRVKNEGRNNMRFFSPDMQADSVRALELASALKQVKMDEEFHLVYQPQLSLKDNRLVGAEALLRWTHPQWGAISPAEFIPIAEQSGRILEISNWVLRSVAHQLAAWQAQGLPKLKVAVNMSALQFLQDNLSSHIIEIVNESGIQTSQIEIELTESVALGDPTGAGERIDELRKAGFTVAIDDFGTGYSSMSYLKRFAVDKLKIDQSFIDELASNPDDQAIVLGIIQMAHTLGMKTIAEGVETADQLEILRAKGCDAIQGYHYSRPLDVQAMEAFLCDENHSA